MTDHLHRWRLTTPYRDSAGRQVTTATCACGASKTQEETDYTPQHIRAAKGMKR